MLKNAAKSLLVVGSILYSASSFAGVVQQILPGGDPNVDGRPCLFFYESTNWTWFAIPFSSPQQYYDASLQILITSRVTGMPIGFIQSDQYCGGVEIVQVML